MTSAPNSASIRAAEGPAINWPISKTRKPSRAFFPTSTISCFAVFLAFYKIISNRFQFLLS
jgi:hypothetical protein